MTLLCFHAFEKTREDRREDQEQNIDSTDEESTQQENIDLSLKDPQHKVFVRPLSRLYTKEIITQATVFVLQYAPCNVVPWQIQYDRACIEEWDHSDSMFDPLPSW